MDRKDHETNADAQTLTFSKPVAHAIFHNMKYKFSMDSCSVALATYCTTKHTFSSRSRDSSH